MMITTMKKDEVIIEINHRENIMDEMTVMVETNIVEEQNPEI